MKIAQLVCVFPPYRGGIGNVAKNFAEQASLNGHESVVITPEYEKGVNFETSNFTVEKLKPFVKYGNAALLPQLFFKLKKFDIIYFHYPFFGADLIVWLAKLFFKKNIKLFIHYHMDVVGLPFYLKPFTWPSKIVFESLVKMSEMITCASFDYLENSLVKNIYYKHRDKFREVPFGVDVERFKPREIEPGKNSLIFVGGLDSAHYFKGLDLLIKTLAAIRDVDWILNIVGSGNLQEGYKALAIRLGIGDRINFLGDVDNVSFAYFYNNATFLVLAAINRNEAFGLVLLEALSSGIPVIASDLPGVRSVFSNNIEGLLFKTGNSKDLEDKIRWMLANPVEVKKMGESGRKLILEKYNWKVIGAKLDNLIKSKL